MLPTSAALWTVWAPIQLFAAVALVLLPISACVAILRHRLYDVDLVIVRTVAYAVIAALLAAVYVAVTLCAAGFVSTPFAAAGAALVVAVTFRPVHDAVQSLADRWLRPARHRAVIATSEFVDALRCGDAPVSGLEAAFRRALRDDRLTLMLELPDGVVVDPEGRDTADGRDRRRAAELRVSTAAGATAVLRHRDGDERLVAAVADAGALAIEIAALRSSCGDTCSRSRHRGGASSRWPTRNDDGSPATFTTAPSRDWSLSDWRCGTHSSGPTRAMATDDRRGGRRARHVDRRAARAGGWAPARLAR